MPTSKEFYSTIIASVHNVVYILLTLTTMALNSVCSLSVRVLQSSRAGVGKSLMVERLTRKLEKLENNERLRRGIVPTLCPTIPVHGVSADPDQVTRTLSSHAINKDVPVSRIYHLDISQSVSLITPISNHYMVSNISYRELSPYLT